MYETDFKIIYLPRNVGHGRAREISLNECSHELVALMDSDDISVPTRFELQLNAFSNNSSISVVGGQIREFSNETGKITGIRKVPLKHEEIKDFSTKRCPMNQVTVMFRSNDVKESGGYLDWPYEEDYYLWIRMLEKGYRFVNIPNILVDVRVGKEMARRRGGWDYFASEVRFQKYMLKKGIISALTFTRNVAIRFIGEVILTSGMREMAYKLLRDSTGENLELEYPQKVKKADVHKEFSVAMCVYIGDNYDAFDIAIESVLNQTVEPTELVLVVDGPISVQLENVIRKYADSCSKVSTRYLDEKEL